MDEQTLAAYDAASGRFAQEWREQPAPADLYDLLRTHFRPGPTVDIGCGAGRDTAWLVASGYAATGYDASEGLLRQARESYPEIRFGLAVLPELTGLPAGTYENVLCETVIMHLDPSVVGAATRRLLALLRPSGTLFLSWRVTEGGSIRDTSGRLYAAFDKRRVTDTLAPGDAILIDREDVNVSSGKKVHRLIVRRSADPS
jgi:2-polyprenyl-3-methyl-5-hydroxy-6-metoxy-1,4-benzoquinol methylase